MTLLIISNRSWEKHMIATITVTATAVHKFIHIYDFLSLLPKGFPTEVYMQHILTQNLICVTYH